mmetsp:Transcript_32081/g.75283  ORF Transcript_32081/g.75283 Transcript_32081/m.75283 type:complete len:294 (-) Transcript_32081:1751-2632(-)
MQTVLMARQTAPSNKTIKRKSAGKEKLNATNPKRLYSAMPSAHLTPLEKVSLMKHPKTAQSNCITREWMDRDGSALCEASASTFSGTAPPPWAAAALSDLLTSSSLAPSFRASCAKLLMVLFVYIAVPGRGTAIAFLSREVALPASRELPPSSGQSTSTLTDFGSLPRTCAHTSWMQTSRALPGCTTSPISSASAQSMLTSGGGGKDFRSILPLAVRGSASRSTNCEGTMYAASLCVQAAFSACACKDGGVAYATMRCCMPSPTTTQTTVFAPAPRMASSISPSSMRKPRIFT